MKKKEENTQTNSTLVAVSSRAVRREKENGREKDYKKSDVNSSLYSSRNLETVREQMLGVDDMFSN